MQGLHLTGDLFECGCSAALLTDLETLSTLCRNATNDSTLTIVDDKWHVFPDWNGQPGGITGTILLAESHLAIHTWPERAGVTLDVYVCNFSRDNSARARQVFRRVIEVLAPAEIVAHEVVRGRLPVGA